MISFFHNWILYVMLSGNLTLNAYEDKCEFADPAGSFKGLSRFKRNCTNFGYLVETSNMKLMKWEDFEVSSQFIRLLDRVAMYTKCARL